MFEDGHSNAQAAARPPFEPKPEVSLPIAPPAPAGAPEARPGLSRSAASHARERGSRAAFRAARLLAPHLTRVSDDSIPDDALEPQERELRALRGDLLDALERGGPLNVGHEAVINMFLTGALTLAHLDAQVLRLARDGALINQKSRAVFPILKQRGEIAGDLARLLWRLGLIGPMRKAVLARTRDLARDLAVELRETRAKRSQRA